MSNEGSLTNEGLLAEVEDLLRNSPSQSALVNEEKNEGVLGWLGRTGAIVEKWDFTKSASISHHINALLAEGTMQLISPPRTAYFQLKTLLFQAQNDLRMKTVGPVSVAISGGKRFDYFDEIRKILEMAGDDLLFVDPYLDAEFVSRYLPQVKEGVAVRLLASKKISALAAAVEIFVKQSGLRVEVRSATSGLHDRHVFVDGARCYQSGASFKDGAKKSQTTLTQITDVFEPVFRAYQRMWDEAKVEKDLG